MEDYIKMIQNSRVVEKTIEENKIFITKRCENARNNILKELYFLAVELSSKKDTAAELEAEKKLEEAVESVQVSSEIIDLATDWYNEGKEAGFVMGFRMATKLLMEGLNGEAVL